MNKREQEQKNDKKKEVVSVMYNGKPIQYEKRKNEKMT